MLLFFISPICYIFKIFGFIFGFLQLKNDKKDHSRRFASKELRIITKKFSYNST